MGLLRGIIVGWARHTCRGIRVRDRCLGYVPALSENGLFYRSLHGVFARSWDEFSGLSGKNGPPKPVFVVVDINFTADVGIKLILILNALAVEKLSA